jgi:hypothetical protein
MFLLSVAVYCCQKVASVWWPLPPTGDAIVDADVTAGGECESGGV